MLEQILDFIHNYFVKDIMAGGFTISGGSVEGLHLLNGQYFKIVGSVLNDGVYCYPTDALVDEQFDGEIWAMAVPPSVIALSTEIQIWVSKYGNSVDSPYQSESFGGYSYTKGSNSAGSSINWQDVFRGKLNRWRKI